MKKIILTFLLISLLCSVTWAVDDPWTISFDDDFEGAGGAWWARSGTGGWYAPYGKSAPGSVLCQDLSNTLPGMSGQIAFDGYGPSCPTGEAIHLLPWPAEQLISDGNIVSVEVSIVSRGGNCGGAVSFGFVTDANVVQNGSWQEVTDSSKIVAGLVWGSRYAGVTTLESWMDSISNTAGESFDVQYDNVVRQKLSLDLITDEKKLEMKRYVSGAWETNWTTVFDWTAAGIDLSEANINGVYIQTGYVGTFYHQMDDLSFELTLNPEQLIHRDFIEDFNEFVSTGEWLRSTTEDGASSNYWYGVYPGGSTSNAALANNTDVLPGMSGNTAHYGYLDGGYSIQMLPDLADMLVSNSSVVTMEISLVSRFGDCGAQGMFGFVVNGDVVENGGWYEVQKDSLLTAGLKWGSRVAGVTTLECFMGSDTAGASFDADPNEVVRQRLSLDLSTDKMKLEMKRYAGGAWGNWGTAIDWTAAGMDLSAANITGVVIQPGRTNYNGKYYQMDDIEIQAYRSGEPVDCADAIALGQDYIGDLDANCVVNMDDLEILASSWLDCTFVGSPGCAPEGTVSPYLLYEGTVIIDANLDEWSDANWFDLNVLYYGNPDDMTNAKWAAKWSDSENLLYVAITGTDAYHRFTNSYDTWETRDAVEIFVDASNSDITPMAPDYIEAQQWAIGPNNNGVSSSIWGGSYWDSLADTGLPASVDDVAVNVTGDVITYEVALYPYSEYVSGYPAGSTELNLAGGMTVGLDVVIATLTDSYGTFGMLSENSIGNKANNAGNFRDFVLEETGSCGDWGQLQADLNTDCRVNFQDFVKLAQDWLNSIF